MYKVSCILRSNKDYSVRKPYSETDRHPDLAKQKIIDKNPGFTMLNISIQDLSIPKRKWDDPVAPIIKRIETKPAINTEKTWRKELSR